MTLVFWAVLKKNLKALANSKISILAMLAGPLVLVVIVALGLGGAGEVQVKAGVYYQAQEVEGVQAQAQLQEVENTPSKELAKTPHGTAIDDLFYNDFLNYLNRERVSTIPYLSLPACKQEVITGKLNTCIEISRTYQQISTEQEVIYMPVYDVIVFLDVSKTRVSAQVLSKVKAAFDAYVEAIVRQGVNEVRAKLDEAKSKLEFANNQLAEVEQQLQLIENSLNAIESFANQLRGNIDEQINALERAQQDISNLQSELDALRDVENFTRFDLLDSISSSLAELSTQLSAARNSAIEARDALSEQITSNAISEARGAIARIRESVSTSRSELNRVLDLINAIENEAGSQLRKPINFQYQPLSASTTGTRVTLLASPPQKPALYVAGQSGKSQVQFSPSFSTTGLLREAGIGLFDLVFPSFVVLFCVLEALLTGAVLTLRERASGAYIRNMTSKASKFGLMFGLFSTIFLIVFVQLFVLVLSSQFFLNLGGSALIKTIAVLFYVAVLLIPFVLVGMLIGYSLNSQEGVIISAIGVALLITIFSPLIIPTETLPKQIGALLSLTPPIVADQKIVLISVFNRIPLYNSLELFSHSFFVAALTAILFFVFRARKNKEV